MKKFGYFCKNPGVGQNQPPPPLQHVSTYRHTVLVQYDIRSGCISMPRLIPIVWLERREDTGGSGFKPRIAMGSLTRVQNCPWSW